MNVALKKFLGSWVVWFYSAIVAAVSGIAHSIAPMVIDPKTFNIHEGIKSLSQTMMVSAVLGLVTYFLKSPIPALPKEFLDHIAAADATADVVDSIIPKASNTTNPKL